MAEDFYAMPSFVTLSVADVSASASWYQSVLGFSVVFTMPGPGGAAVLAHLRLARYADLLLVAARTPVPVPRGAGVQINFTLADRTVDDLAAHAKGRWSAVEGPIAQPWNARELYVVDPDGYRLAFVQQANAGLGIEDVVENVGNASGLRSR
jgi:catechol 2,3-dioxygenase-like lactoylglutathione lyase family enzyme